MADHVLKRRHAVPAAPPVDRVLVATLLYGGLALCALAVALASGLLLYDGWSHQAVVDPGLRAGGVDLGGMTESQAAARLEQALPSVAPQQVTLSYNGQGWEVPAAALGVRYDARETAARAFAYGHEGDLWSRSLDLLRARSRGVQVPVSFTIDEQAAFSALQQVAPSIVVAPVNAHFHSDESGQLAVDPGRPGVALDSAATVAQLRQRLQTLSSAPVMVQTTQAAPPVQAGDLQPALGVAKALAGQPVVLRHGASSWQVPADALQAMLQIPAPGQSQPATLARQLLSDYLAPLGSQLQSPGKNASVAWSGKEYTVVKSVPGEEFDLAATTDEVLAALAQDRHAVEVKTRPVPAAGDAEAQRVAERANAMIGQPFSLTWDGGSVVVPADGLAKAVRVEQQPGTAPAFSIVIDDARLRQALDGVRDKVASPAKDAQFRYLDGKVTVVAPEQQGTTLDVPNSVAAIHDALAGGRHAAGLVVTKVDPKVTAAAAGNIVIRERLASGQTSYAGSVPNRRYNVELAVSRVNGALIAPGATFSFTGTIGAVDTANGYKLGYGIEQTSNGKVTTVPSVGGGICQVATTAFHAVWWAGMPIVERNWHLYWIPLYGVAPSGITGLDATVDTDAGLDFKFKNVSENWLAVVATADGQNVRFEIWGTDPGWKVQVDDPQVTNTVKADTKMKYENSDTLKKGESVLVEHAADGFDVTLHRRVTKGDQVIDDVTLKSHYVPSENITMVGTG